MKRMYLAIGLVAGVCITAIGAGNISKSAPEKKDVRADEPLAQKPAETVQVSPQVGDIWLQRTKSPGNDGVEITGSFTDPDWALYVGNSGTGHGIVGISSEIGVYGQTDGTGWYGVGGINTGDGIGVYGVDSASLYEGVRGCNKHENGSGILGAGNNLTSLTGPTVGAGVIGNGTALGMWAKATNTDGNGIVGLANNLSGYYTLTGGAGVTGNGDEGVGVYGRSNSGSGVYAYSDNGQGMGCNVNNTDYYTLAVFGVSGDFLYVDSSATATAWNIHAKTSKGEVAMTTITSPKPEIYVSGTGILKSGEARVSFNYPFNELVSDEVPIIVTVTPTTECNGLYIAETSSDGFVVRELNNGKSSATFNWIAVGREKGREIPGPKLLAKATGFESAKTLKPRPVKHHTVKLISREREGY